MTTMLQTRNTRKILVVDDEDGIRLTLKRLLMRLPAALAAEVETARSAEEAFELLEQKEYSMILTDFNMEGKDGITLLEAARQRWPATVRCLMTGYTDQNIVEAANERGAVAAFIRKPWDNRQLLETVGNLLKEP